MKKSVLIAVAIFCVLGTIAGICYGTGVFDKIGTKNPNTGAALFGIIPTSLDHPVGNPAASGDIENDLRVDLDSTKDYYPEVSWEFLDYQMINQDAARVDASGLSDAVSFPFIIKESLNLDNPSETTYDYDYMFSQVKEEILRSPVYCDMVIRGMKDIEISTGKTIGELNPWMAEFVAKTDNFMSINPNTHPRGMECWVTFRSGQGNTIFVSDEFRPYAVRTCLLLERLVPVGIEAWKSTENYVLNYTATNSSRRTELASYQEDREALIFCYIRKDTYADFSIGFNLADKRFEYYKDKGVAGYGDDPYVPTVTPTQPPVNPTPVPTNPPVPTPVPTNPPVTPTDPPKNPSQDPVNQGNAEQGGGENQSGDGAGEFQPEKPAFVPPIVTNPDSSSESDDHSGSWNPFSWIKIPSSNTSETPSNLPSGNPDSVTITPAGDTVVVFGDTSYVNPNPPPAVPAVVPETHGIDNSTGDVVIFNDDNVSDGTITLPD